MGRFPLLVCGFGAVISTSVVMCRPLMGSWVVYNRLLNTIQKGLEFFSSVALRSIANFEKIGLLLFGVSYFLINLFHEGRRFAFCRLLLRYLHLGGGSRVIVRLSHFLPYFIGHMQLHRGFFGLFSSFLRITLWVSLWGYNTSIWDPGPYDSWLVL